MRLIILVLRYIPFTLQRKHGALRHRSSRIDGNKIQYSILAPPRGESLVLCTVRIFPIWGRHNDKGSPRHRQLHGAAFGSPRVGPRSGHSARVGIRGRRIDDNIRTRWDPMKTVSTVSKAAVPARVENDLGEKSRHPGSIGPIFPGDGSKGIRPRRGTRPDQGGHRALARRAKRAFNLDRSDPVSAQRERRHRRHHTWPALEKRPDTTCL